MRDEIGHSYLVIGNRIMGWESWGQAMPQHEQHTTQKLRAYAKINEYQIPGRTRIDSTISKQAITITMNVDSPASTSLHPS